MSQHALMAALVLAVMVIASFWRQLLRLLLALLIVTLGLGLYELVAFVHHV